MSEWVEPAWFAEAACTGMDPDLFFPPPGGNPSAAKRICFSCPVRLQCLDYAVENFIVHGVFGGMSERERRTARRRKRAT